MLLTCCIGIRKGLSARMVGNGNGWMAPSGRLGNQVTNLVGGIHLTHIRVQMELNPFGTVYPLVLAGGLGDFANTTRREVHLSCKVISLKATFQPDPIPLLKEAKGFLLNVTPCHQFSRNRGSIVGHLHNHELRTWAKLTDLIVKNIAFNDLIKGIVVDILNWNGWRIRNVLTNLRNVRILYDHLALFLASLF